MHKLLFVHPDQKLNQIYTRYLKQHFRVDSAHDGLAALRSFRANPSSLIVSEYHLPLLSGIGLLKFVRTHPKFYAVPFIFLTTHHDNSEALGLGANGWFDSSNCHPESLLDHIYQIRKLARLASIETY